MFQVEIVEKTYQGSLKQDLVSQPRNIPERTLTSLVHILGIISVGHVGLTGLGQLPPTTTPDYHCPGEGRADHSSPNKRVEGLGNCGALIIALGIQQFALHVPVASWTPLKETG